MLILIKRRCTLFIKAAVKLYSESLEQQAALKAVLQHYSSVQSQESEQDLLRDIWNGNWYLKYVYLKRHIQKYKFSRTLY